MLKAFTYVDLYEVYGYESFGVTYGVKVLTETFIDAVGEYRYVVQHGRAKKGEDFKPDGEGKSLSLATVKEIKECYEGRYVKEDLLKPVKGDVLVATTSDGTKMLFVYETEDVVHRLTKGGSFYSEQSWASLITYKREFPDLKVLSTNTYGGKKFSEL